MGLDDRDAEPLFLIALVGIVIAVGLPALLAFGLRDWPLAFALIGIVTGSILAAVVALNCVNMWEWLRDRIGRSR